MHERSKLIRDALHLPLTLQEVDGEIHLSYTGGVTIQIALYGDYIDWYVKGASSSDGDACVLDVQKVVFDILQALREVE